MLYFEPKSEEESCHDWILVPKHQHLPFPISRKTVSLKDFSGERFVIYFYPADDTPSCTKEACQFNDGLSAFRKLGVERSSACRPDGAVKHATFRKKYGLTFDLLSDRREEGHEPATARSGEKMMYGKKVTGVIRSTFVIGPSAKIEHAWGTAFARTATPTKSWRRLRSLARVLSLHRAPAVPEPVGETEDHDRNDRVLRGVKSAAHVLPIRSGRIAESGDQRHPHGRTIVVRTRSARGSSRPCRPAPR